MIPQGVLGKHTFDRFGQESVGSFRKTCCAVAVLSPPESRYDGDKVRGHFVARSDGSFPHSRSRHGHPCPHEGKVGRVFATQHPCDAGCQSPQRFPSAFTRYHFSCTSKAFACMSHRSSAPRYRVNQVSCTSGVPISFDSSFASQASRFVRAPPLQHILGNVDWARSPQGQ